MEEKTVEKGEGGGKSKELLTYSKNKERKRFGTTEEKIMSPIPLQSLSSNGDDPGTPTSPISVTTSSPISHI